MYLYGMFHVYLEDFIIGTYWWDYKLEPRIISLFTQYACCLHHCYVYPSWIIVYAATAMMKSHIMTSSWGASDGVRWPYRTL